MSIAQTLTSASERQAIQERDDALAWLEHGRPGVTVCITYHDEELELLERAWWSVAAQTVKPTEIIVVDDGSEKPLKGRWQPATDSHPTRVVGVTNRGLPAARNVGLMLATCEGFLPLDCDDRLAPSYIEKTLPLLLNGADVVLTGLQEHGPTRNGTYMPGYDRPWHLCSLELMWLMNRYYYASLFRTQTLREVGGYNPLMAGAFNQNGGLEDWDLTLDLMSRGAKYAACDEVLFHYSTENPQSMAHTMNRPELEAEMKRHHRR
jgi:cellulose synthase/poly-beta-1,6-N-acetylglucosamine synthase-like glycosyltransferase